MPPTFFQRVADGSLVLAPDGYRAFAVPPGWTWRAHPGESLAGVVGGPGQVTGYLELVPPPTAQGVAVLSWHQTSTFTHDAADIVPILLRNSSGGAITVNGFELYPHGALTANDAAYVSIEYALTAITGGAITAVVAGATTKTIGAGGTGDWTAYTPIAIGVGPFTIPNGKTARLVLEQHGSGVDVPPFDLLAY